MRRTEEHSQHTPFGYRQRSLLQCPQSLVICVPVEGHLGGKEVGGSRARWPHRHLGRFLGEFGSVREAQLKQEDGSFVKVAVKMLKGE